MSRVILDFWGGILSDEMVECKHKYIKEHKEDVFTVERKTIGKFISVLRRANGMTQRELGEKLFVSDKTVSRWERDECTPELSLIPVIAEIFGITTDELLRGERNNSDASQNTENVELIERQKAKSDRQFRFMLNKKQRDYKSLTLMSIGLTLLGVIITAIINLGFSKGLIAFCVGAAFCIASEMSQICICVNARLIYDDEEEAYAEKIDAYNTSVIMTSVRVSFFNIAAFAFCLPLVTIINGTNFGLKFGFWLGSGALFASVCAVVSYIVYELLIKKLLMKRCLISLSDTEKEIMSRNIKLLKKTLAISLGIALAILAVTVLLNTIIRAIGPKKHVFDNCDDFKTFVQNDYDRWFNEGYGYYDKNGDLVISRPIGSIYVEGEKEPIESEGEENEEYPRKIYAEITNSKGEIICEYYYNPDLYYDITFTEFTNDKMPVTVITKEDYYAQLDVNSTIKSFIYFLICVDIVISIAIYAIKLYRIKRSVQTDLARYT